MALGSTCSAPYTFKFEYFKVYSYSSIWPGEGLLAYNCYPQGVFASCDDVPGGPFNTSVTSGSGSLLGCVENALQYGCPAGYPFQFLTVTTTIGVPGFTYTRDRCLATGALAACEAPAVVPPDTTLAYSTPGYTKGTLTACIRAAAGPAAGVSPPAMYNCPTVYPIAGVSSANPLQQPPSASADIISSCHSADSLCYRDVPLLPFHLIGLGVPLKLYVSRLPSAMNADSAV